MTATPETPWGENLCTNTSTSMTWPATAAARSACSARSTESRCDAPKNSQIACRPTPVASKCHLRRNVQRASRYKATTARRQQMRELLDGSEAASPCHEVGLVVLALRGPGRHG